MKKKRVKGKEGVTLVEVLVAITVLGIVTAALGGSLVVSNRINSRSEQIIKDRLAVSSAVETLMAEGIEKGKIDYSSYYPSDTTLDVTIEVGPEDTTDPDCYKVTVKSTDGEVSVETYICPAPADTTTPGGT